MILPPPSSFNEHRQTNMSLDPPAYSDLGRWLRHIKFKFLILCAVFSTRFAAIEISPGNLSSCQIGHA